MNHKPLVYILAGAVGVFLLISLFAGTADADDTVDDLQAQILLLEERIEQTSREYVVVAAEAAEAREWCNVVTEKETQLRRFNELNTSRRAEKRLVERKLDRLKAEGLPQ